MNINLLYCFDKNYNKQAYISVMSILKKLDSDVSLHILHNEPESFLFYKNKISEVKNVKYLNLYKFRHPNLEFPNLKDKHVSIATYFRMFIEDYIPQNIETLIYIDPDVICLNNPKDAINSTMNELTKSNYIIAAREAGNNKDSKYIFQRLGLNGNSYFNAGVMFIDYKKWKNIKEKLIKLMDAHHEKITFWDQDVLNLFFDGEYRKIESSLNYNVVNNFDDKKYVDSLSNTVIFLHYSGKIKPWSLHGFNLYYSKHYLDIYRSLFNEKYHIDAGNNKSKFILDSLKSIASLKFLKLEYPIAYVKILLKNIIFILY